MESLGRTGVSHQDLQRYFDGELTGSEKQELDAQIEAEPCLKWELDQLEILRSVVVESATLQAERVPAARFEQVWAEIERTIERDAREQRAQRAPQGPWARLRAALKPLRLPGLVVVAAAGVAWLVVSYSRPGAVPADLGTGGIAEAVTEVPAPAAEVAPVPPRRQGAAAGGAGRMAASDQEASMDDDGGGWMTFTPPKPGDADVHNVEFGGRTGRIAQTGTVTVLYVEEDVEPKDSERSL